MDAELASTALLAVTEDHPRHYRHDRAMRRSTWVTSRASGWWRVEITRKKGERWISVPSLDKQEEPAGLKALKAEISRRWA
ncbi:hypothetical protein [Microbispora siamensis]|uniref:DUF3024 domain-containing protein n=1 Tax=Microbispora siamensis TaxID=564413 RepID=A0ABQ4GK87_9ACTN|nr:hypothetical protein [Microbispora siamensis]GIH61784.1 hypothetical protein Msi02_26010 [Microbispora siamensis]